MVTNNKVLTVSYGTFSCTLEGFEDSFDTMKVIAEYFRDLAADDRYFGAEPPVPDADMMARIAEKEVARRVQARSENGTMVLTTGAALAEQSADHAEEITQDLASDVTDVAGEDYAAALQEDALQELSPEDDAADEITDAFTEAETAETDLAEDIAETPAIDEDELEAERAAFLAEADTVASAHSKEVAADVAAHEEDAPDGAPQEETIVEAPVKADEANAVESVAEDAPEDDAEDAVAEIETEDAQFADAPVEEDAAPEAAVAETNLADTPLVLTAADKAVDDFEAALDDQIDVAPAQEDTKTEDTASVTEEFFAASPVPKDAGVSNIAAKLNRIRSVVSKSDQEEGEFSEDEHAENPAADFLRQSATDIETSLDEADDVDVEDTETAEEPAPTKAKTLVAPEPKIITTQARKGRIIRMAQPKAADAEQAEEQPKKPSEKQPEKLEDDLEEVVGEDTIAEFESGYSETALDETSFDEEEEAPQPEPVQETVRPNRRLPELSEEDAETASVNRLMSTADSKLDDPSAGRRRTTLAHLRAAVAATQTEKAAGTYEGDKDQSGAYREDLADVMRPREAAEAPSAPVEVTEDDAPLRLVPSQRVDEPEPQTAPQSEAIRPRRVSPADIASFEKQETTEFADYIDEVGARELPEILEAAASYLTYVEGRRRFSRPMLMRLAYQVGPESFQREAGLRSFGQLLRDKKIEKIAGGRFTVSESIRFKPAS